MAGENKLNFGADNLAYLEEPDEYGVASTDVDILKRASDFGVDLDIIPIKILQKVPGSKVSGALFLYQCQMRS